MAQYTDKPGKILRPAIEEVLKIGYIASAGVPLPTSGFAVAVFVE